MGLISGIIMVIIGFILTYFANSVGMGIVGQLVRIVGIILVIVGVIVILLSLLGVALLL